MATISARFDRVVPFYLTVQQKNKLNQGIAAYGYTWTHSNFDWFKKFLQRKLRKRQFDACCYCRRPLKFDKGLVEIEHVINKSKTGKYLHFTFEIKNLALSCKDCNNGKGTKSVLVTDLTNSLYPKNGTPYMWVHPYFHKYSDHITIHQEWVYEATNASPQGFAVIDKCKLALLKEKERKNRKILINAAADFESALHRAVGLVSEVGLDKLCRELAPSLALMMKGSKDVARAAQAIRDAHSAVEKIALAANP